MADTDRQRRTGAIQRWASSLRFPYLFVLLAGVFAVDLLVPDFIPFADEIALGLLTALFGMWRDRRKNEVIDVEPEESKAPPAP